MPQYFNSLLNKLIFCYFLGDWGCPDGYYMNQGHCYKLFRENFDYTDAEMKCQEEDAILARPITFTQAEFIESMVKYEDQISNSTTLEKKIFLGYHFWDTEGYNDDHFKVLRTGLDLGPNTDFTKDCVVMKFDSEGIHLGWKWSPCEEVSLFICQKSKHYLKTITLFFFTIFN